MFEGSILLLDSIGCDGDHRLCWAPVDFFGFALITPGPVRTTWNTYRQSMVVYCLCSVLTAHSLSKTTVPTAGRNSTYAYGSEQEASFCCHFALSRLLIHNWDWPTSPLISFLLHRKRSAFCLASGAPFVQQLTHRVVFLANWRNGAESRKQ